MTKEGTLRTFSLFNSKRKSIDFFFEKRGKRRHAWGCLSRHGNRHSKTLFSFFFSSSFSFGTHHFPGKTFGCLQKKKEGRRRVSLSFSFFLYLLQGCMRSSHLEQTRHVHSAYLLYLSPAPSCLNFSCMAWPAGIWEMNNQSAAACLSLEGDTMPGTPPPLSAGDEDGPEGSPCQHAPPS